MRGSKKKPLSISAAFIILTILKKNQYINYFSELLCIIKNFFKACRYKQKAPENYFLSIYIDSGQYIATERPVGKNCSGFRARRIHVFSNSHNKNRFTTRSEITNTKIVCHAQSYFLCACIQVYF